jgi:3,4-dihydroxy 2-butanone 4-phosphate synthase/GTP cyclohydrolase II
VTADTVADRVTEAARSSLPTSHGRFEAIGFFDLATGDEHLVLVSPLGVGNSETPALVRVQSECLTGDVFGSQRCDCGAQLQQALALIAGQPGALIYLRGHEGRGLGLLAKLEAYRLQDAGLDTVDAQLELGLPVDSREYGAATAILDAMGVTRVRLLTNNPDKVHALRVSDVDLVAVEPLYAPSTPSNAAYLRAKRDRLGHTLPMDVTPA